jgi:antitoxin component HigA of HigAB toxin-antitoxin module
MDPANLLNGVKFELLHIIHEPQNHAEYEKLANMLDESHQKPLQQESGIVALKFLMEQHRLDQNDFKKEIGSLFWCKARDFY